MWTCLNVYLDVMYIIGKFLGIILILIVWILYGTLIFRKYWKERLSLSFDYVIIILLNIFLCPFHFLSVVNYLIGLIVSEIYGLILFYLSIILNMIELIKFFHKKRKLFKLVPTAPALKSSNDLISKGFESVYNVLQKNLVSIGQDFRYAIPAPRFFGGCYLWDSAFISQIWKFSSPKISEEILLPLFKYQAENGRISHIISIFGPDELTQPPVLAWAINNLQEISNLEYFYEGLKKYNRFLYQNHRHPSGLFYWHHAYESGIDNSPRFSDVQEKEVIDTKRLAAVDLNSFIALQNKSLAQIALRLNKLNESKQFEEKYKEIKSLINSKLWDQNSGYYYDLDFEKNEFVKIRTIASFFPLFAEIPDPERVKILLNHLRDENEFNTVIPLPSVARDDPNFMKDMWRGPVWINTAYIIIKGLEIYSYHKEATDFAYKIIMGVFKLLEKRGYFYEFYDPDKPSLEDLSRKKGNLWKRITLGSKPVKNFVGWTGLVNNLLIENIIGIKKLENVIEIRPCIPDELKNSEFELNLPVFDITIKIIKINKIVEINGKIKDREFRESVKNYEKIEIII